MPFGEDFDHTVEETMAHLNIDEVRLELEVQILRLVDAGIKPKHLDSHIGLAAASLGTSVSLVGIYDLPGSAKETLESRKAAYGDYALFMSQDWKDLLARKDIEL